MPKSKKSAKPKNAELYRLEFRFGVSKARDTEGYTICSLKVNGKRVSMIKGCGFDLKGAVMGIWVSREFPEIATLPANYGSQDVNEGFYGLIHRDKTTNKWVQWASENTTSWVDGACGTTSICRILEAIGLEWGPHDIVRPIEREYKFYGSLKGFEGTESNE